jgi:osmotically-inducible protein OsmY
MTMRSDRELQDQVLQELRWDTRIDAAEIGVAVQEAVAALSGSVKSFAERQAAEEAALRISGIHDVANNIQVNVPGHLVRADADLAHAVRGALEWHSFLPSDRIKTTVTGGIVTLHGTADSWWQVADAESVVGNLAGVRDVVSELVVLTPEIDPQTILHDIEHALERRADRLAQHINISIEHGHVVLRGTVHSAAERRAVLGAARFTHGVREVEDRLRVEHPDGTWESSEHLHAAPLPV